MSLECIYMLMHISYKSISKRCGCSHGAYSVSLEMTGNVTKVRVHSCMIVSFLKHQLDFLTID